MGDSRDSQWDSEHVLLALVQQREGLARDVLNRMGIDAEALAREIKAHLDQSPKLAYDVVQIYTTPRIVRMLEAANAEADRLKDDYVGVAHLLIAIADEGAGASAKSLERAEVSEDRTARAPPGGPGRARGTDVRRARGVRRTGRLRHAQGYAARQWRVFTCRPRAKEPATTR